MRRSWIAMVFFAGVLVAQGAAEGTARVSALPRPLPTAGETVLVAGSYATRNFKPTFSFATSGGWRVEHDAANGVFFHGSPCCAQHVDASTGFLFFVRPAMVYDPDSDVPVAAPANLLGWLRANPHLKTGPVSPVTIGAAPGEQFTASFRSQTKNGGGCADLRAERQHRIRPL